jgi:hypothetical protein
VAVVSQPGKRGAHSPAPGPLDSELKEFWTTNPWNITAEGHNLSAYERKRTFLNLQGKGFLDISFLTGADNNGDGRSVIACDFRNNGQLDLVVRQVGGGPFLLFENHFPRQHYLEVSLRGKRSNRLGIGARLTAIVNGRQIVRELYPANTFLSQAPSRVHFGLAQDSKVDRLTIRWPSGVEQVLSDLAGDRHIIIEEDKEGADAVTAVVPGRRNSP